MNNVDSYKIVTGKNETLFLPVLFIALFLGVTGKVFAGQSLSVHEITQADTFFSIDANHVSVKDILYEIQQKTGYSFMYQDRELGQIRKSISLKNTSLDNCLDELLKGSGYTYTLQGKTIAIVRKSAVEEKKPCKVKGKITDEAGQPVIGATVVIKGTSVGVVSDVDGVFHIDVPQGGILQISFVGMKSQEHVINGDNRKLDILLKADVKAMDEVVVTGIFQRKKESFTGSTSTFKAENLKMVGTQNLIQSLKTLDPSFVIMENNDFGSDPNRQPNIEIRGKSSIVGLKEQYDTDPNQPLFILDGFETDLKTVVDLNMDRVQSVTILKDAASTALYGSKAANGVVVIETKQPLAGTFRVSYNGNFSLSIPDLSDYNLMNAAEKLEFERKAGFYTSQIYHDATEQLFLDSLYNLHLQNIARGVDTYWLSEPLKVAFVHKHNLYAEGGDGNVRYGLGMTYNSTDGVMKGSGNNLVGINFDLIYRKGKLRFFNKMSFDHGKEENNIVSFSEFARANPYLEKTGKDGKISRFLEKYEVNGQNYITENPLYNASLNNFDVARTTNFVNKFNAEWRPVDGMMLRGRLSLGKKIRKSERFLSPQHTSFETKPKNKRGSYSSAINDSWFYEGDFTLTYGKLLGGVHQVNAVLGTNFRSSETKNEGYKAYGFPEGDFSRPSFATDFGEGSKPSYMESVTRSNSFYLNAGYSYDNRYLVDANIRMDGASVFGSNKHYTETWAFGLAWNIHNEHFLKDYQCIDLLKIRASIGNPGNQNFDAFQSFTTFSFNNWISNNFGTSVLIDAFGNPDLKWQKTIDRNFGLDLALFNNRFGLNFDYYQKKTDPLLAVISVPSSVGTKTVTTNMGEQHTEGYSGTVKYSPVYRPEEGINWSVNLNFRHQKAKFKNIGNSLDQFNEKNRNSSLERFHDGGSPSALWAVRSLGIDPANGKEVFVKKDGSYTYTFDARDEVEIGNSEPDLEGVIGTTLYYKGFTFSMHLRYSLGADVFNEAVYAKVENISRDNLKYNQDARALYDRWDKPGQHARFKGISLTETTPMSSRFVKTENFIKGESFSVGYELPKKWIDGAGLSAMRVQMNMNDIFRISSVKQERGIEYPFARMVSASLSLTF